MADAKPQTQKGIVDTNTGELEQSIEISSQRAIQQDVSSSSNRTTHHHVRPYYPHWPTSKPGPLAMQPLPDQWPINLLRREQMVEIGNDQAIAEPS